MLVRGIPGVKILVFLCSLGAPLLLLAQSFDEQIEFAAERSEADLVSAISAPETLPGSVIASPSRHNPNYWYYWVRDGAHIIFELVELYKSETSLAKRRFFEILIWDYVRLSRQLQRTPNLSGLPDREGLGEPKFHLDGSSFNEAWGRPQDDGPALRARALAEFALALIDQEDYESAEKVYHGYQGGPLKVDLEFVAEFHSRPSFEMWEEVEGDHLATLLQHHRALVAGRQVAQALGDELAVRHYQDVSNVLAQRINGFWSEERAHLIQTQNRRAGLDYKESGLDAGVIIAILDYHPNDPLPPWDIRVLLTALKLKEEMEILYSINQNITRDWMSRPLMPGIGRYPEDRYSGNGVSEGNPWFLTTASFAELSYEAASRWLEDGELKLSAEHLRFIRGWVFDSTPFSNLRADQTITAKDEVFWRLLGALLEAGDGYLRRYFFHAGGEATPAEQFDRHTGFQRGAERLTWNCAAMLGSIRARRRLIEGLSSLP